MRRTLTFALGVLLLAVGPVYPYLHLAVLPHHLCHKHGVFEPGPARGRATAKVRGPGSATAHLAARGSTLPPLPAVPAPDPEDGHETCTLASLTLGSALSPQIAQPIALAIEPSRAGACHHADAPPPHRRRNLTLAPKTSPPDDLPG